MVVKWIRSRTSKQVEPSGKQCTGCRTLVGGETDAQLRASGGVFLAGAGWFCGSRCERQYRLRFRIQTAVTPADGGPQTPTRSSTPANVDAANAPLDPEQAPTVDELAVVLRERRRRLLNGQ